MSAIDQSEDSVVNPSREAESRQEFDELLPGIKSLHARALAITAEPKSALARLDARTPVAPFSYAVKFQLQVAASHLALLINAAAIDDTIQYGGYSLIRGALEAGVTARWLMLPGTDAKRVLRSLQLAWSDQGDANEFADATGLSYEDDLVRIRANLDGDRQRMKALQQSTLDKPRVHRTAMIREVDQKTKPGLVPSIESAWRLCSGLAHGNQPTANMMFQRRRLDPTNPDLYVAESSWAIVTPMVRTTLSVLEVAVDQLSTLARA